MYRELQRLVQNSLHVGNDNDNDNDNDTDNDNDNEKNIRTREPLTLQTDVNGIDSPSLRNSIPITPLPFETSKSGNKHKFTEDDDDEIEREPTGILT